MFAQIFSNFFHGIAIGELAYLPEGTARRWMENPFLGEHLLAISQALLSKESEERGGLYRQVTAMISESYFDDAAMRSRASDALLARAGLYGVVFNPRPWLHDKLKPLLLPFQARDPYAKLAVSIVGNVFCDAASSVEGLNAPLDGERIFWSVQQAVRDIDIREFPAAEAEQMRLGLIFTSFIKGQTSLEDSILAVQENPDPDAAILHTTFKAIMIAFIFDVATEAADMAKALVPGDVCCAALAAAYSAVTRSRNPGQTELMKARSVFANCWNVDSYQVDERLEHLRLVIKPIAARKAWVAEGWITRDEWY